MKTKQKKNVCKLCLLCKITNCNNFDKLICGSVRNTWPEPEPEHEPIENGPHAQRTAKAGNCVKNGS